MSDSQARQRVRGLSVCAADPEALAQRWAQVLGIQIEPEQAPASGKPGRRRLALQDGFANFVSANEPNDAKAIDRINGFSLEVTSVPAVLSRARAMGLPVLGESITVLGAVVALSPKD